MWHFQPDTIHYAGLGSIIEMGDKWLARNRKMLALIKIHLPWKPCYSTEIIYRLFKAVLIKMSKSNSYLVNPMTFKSLLISCQNSEFSADWLINELTNNFSSTQTSSLNYNIHIGFFHCAANSQFFSSYSSRLNLSKSREAEFGFGFRDTSFH